MKSIFVFTTIIAIALAQAPVNPVDQCLGDAKSLLADLKAIQQYVKDSNWVKVIVTLDSIAETVKDGETVCKSITANDLLQWFDAHTTPQQKICVGDAVIFVLGVKQLIGLIKEGDWKQFIKVLDAVVTQGEQTATDCKGAFKKRQIKHSILL